uniref:Uncharacterized protein n=1 Tax=Magallana gigas TaxID=29159 RepID=A0A8W8JVK4_MAGGI
MEGNQQMSEEMSVLAIEVSETQRETIRQLFAHNDWEFNEVPIEENRSNCQALQDTEESDPHFEDHFLCKQTQANSTYNVNHYSGFQNFELLQNFMSLILF